MTSTMTHQQHANANRSNGYTNTAVGVAYHYPTTNTFYETNSALHPAATGYQPMMPPYFFSAQVNPPPPPMMPSYPPPYPQAGYVAQPQAPPPPPQHHYHPGYHYAPQQMNYGSWSGASTPPISQHQVQYQPYHMILPPPDTRRGRSSASMKNNEEQYGSLELSVFNVENENLASALNFVRRNPTATLFDIDGIIPEVAMADEGASRFIQKRLRLGTAREQRLGLTAAISSIEDLWGDHYGNFMLQGLFEFGLAEEKKELMDAIYGQDVVALCLHTHGCRVIQKAIRCLGQEDVCKLITQFHDKVLTFTHDPNGNHVIQRCIQVMSSFSKCASNNGDPDLALSLSNQMQFIIDDIIANIETLATHRYGCRVVQRAIEHCEEQQKDDVLDKIISCHEKLAVDQYGNYVIQQVLMCGSEDHQATILKTLTDDNALLTLSKHKYASNVVEAVLIHGKVHHKNQILEAMLKDTRGDEEGEGYCCAIELSKDPIANYVVKKAIDVSEGDQQEIFFEVISSSRQELSESPYGKYVLKRIDKLEKIDK